jgi:hypothetical protein
VAHQATGFILRTGSHLRRVRPAGLNRMVLGTGLLPGGEPTVPHTSGVRGMRDRSLGPAFRGARGLYARP